MPDAANKGKLLALLRLFDAEEPTRKKFINEMIAYAQPLSVQLSSNLKVTTNTSQLVRQIRILPRRRTRTPPRNRIHLRLRTRRLRRRTPPPPRHERVTSPPRKPRVRLVRHRRLPHSRYLRRPRRPPLPPIGQRARRLYRSATLHHAPRILEPLSRRARRKVETGN